MLSKKELKQLETDDKLRSPVLSLYLNLDKKTPEGQHYLAELRKMLSVANKQIVARYKETGKLQKQLHDQTVPRLLNFIDDTIKPDGAIRAIAVFASLAEKQTRQNQEIVFYPLPRPLRSQVHLENKPFIRPLLFLLDQYEQYAVIVANQHNARFYLIGMGEVEQNAEFDNPLPHRSDEGGWSQKRYERRIDNAIKQHIRRVIKHAEKQIKNSEVNRIILGGDSDILSLLKKNLSARAQKMVVGSISTKPHESASEVLEHTMAIASEAEHMAEREAVNDLRNALAHQGKAVVGVADVIKATNEKRVEKLILIQGFNTPGAFCANCNTLSLPMKRCPNCQTVTRPLEDVIESIVDNVFMEDGNVEFVEESIDLLALGSVGAILRF